MKQPEKNLAEQVMVRLSGDIRGGRLAPGTRLPTEQMLTTELGVSRTVVREAVAALRADGLIVTRRGSGAYVADPSAGPFRIVPPQATSLSDILNVMELRLAIEVQAAGLAAERADRKQLGSIRAAWRAIDAALKRGEGAVVEDFSFHRAIAEATGNDQFPGFLAYLGSHVIPRQSVRLDVDTPAERRLYLERIQAEHTRIVTAIVDREPGEARRAMRDHLTRSLDRYRTLAGGSRNGRR
ncbi:FadR/GntR family transcriptional regulator [Reyranella sp.]|uniref:FadR/GntR family transcriptional regulator n=1 Tax=Reyranella sp. TaxID=1929291 RepID=UPI003BA8A9C4